MPLALSWQCSGVDLNMIKHHLMTQVGQDGVGIGCTLHDASITSEHLAEG